MYSADSRDLALAETAAGRSKKTIAAFRFLAGLGRPATAEELRRAGFGTAVWKRLAGAGAVSATEQSRRAAPESFRSASPVTLTAAQQTALDQIGGALRDRSFFPALLFGVTGSGKTEIYLRSIAETLATGRGAVWLVPEIALTPVFARTLEERFGGDAVVLHSALGESRRSEAWKRMRSGSARIVIGPRSAVFAPISAIGLFVIDEEHDGSYKQGESPRYDARDAAAIRAQAHGAVLLLGSATPSVETLHAAREGRLALLELPERIEKRPLPAVEIVDLRKEPWLPEEKGSPLFSRSLVERLREVFSRGEQAIVLAPRRGYAPVLLCRQCGERLPLRFVQRSAGRAPARSLARLSLLRRATPDPRAVRGVRGSAARGHRRGNRARGGEIRGALSRDATRRPRLRHGAPKGRRREHPRFDGGWQDSGADRDSDGREGTSLPPVTAIGVLSADTILNFPDFRASEKTFQLIAQVSGRAGRGERGGTVHVQTFQPENAALRAAITHDSAGFVQRELEFRKTFLLSAILGARGDPLLLRRRGARGRAPLDPPRARRRPVATSSSPGPQPRRSSGSRASGDSSSS